MRAKQIVTRLLEDAGGLSFTTKLTDRSLVDVLGTPDGWYLSSVNAVVEWSVEIDARSWGIKSIDASVRTLRMDCIFEVGEEGQERLVEFVYPGEPAADPSDLKAHALELTGPLPVNVDTQMACDRNGITVSGIELHYGQRQCVVQFG